MGKVTHGMSNTPTYKSWLKMLERCNNPNSNIYSYYGGRGITVCKRWLKFENFFADMGVRPDLSFELDRRNPDKGYTKRNCRWLKQGKGITRRTHYVDGAPLHEAAAELGMNYYTARSRSVKYGTLAPDPHVFGARPPKLLFKGYSLKEWSLKLGVAARTLERRIQRTGTLFLNGEDYEYEQLEDNDPRR